MSKRFEPDRVNSAIDALVEVVRRADEANAIMSEMVRGAYAIFPRSLRVRFLGVQSDLEEALDTLDKIL